MSTVLSHFHVHPSSPPGDILMMAISFLEKDNEQCSKINILSPSCTESECGRQDSHPGLIPNVALFPSTPCSFWMACQVLCKFLLFLCHFSEVHFSLLQLHKRPITPTSDLLPLIGFPTAVAPFQRLHDLLLSTQSTAPRRHWQPGSRSFQWLILLPSQSKQLISNLSVIHHSSALNSPITFPSSTSEAR